MPEPSQTQTPKNSRETRQKGLFHRPALWWREWAKPFLLNYQWLIIGAFLLGAAVLGFLAVHTNNPNSSWQNKLYDTVQIFTMNSSLGDDQYRRSHALALAQVCAVLFFLTFSGKVVWLVFRDQLQLLRLRFWYWFRKDYIIICGLGRLGRGLALGLLSKGQRVIVIELYEHNNYIQEIRDRGGIVLIGDGSKETVLQTAMVTGANRIICSAGDDGLNSDIAATATNLVKYVNRKVPLICNVHIADPGTMELLRERELNAEEVPQIRLQFFSRFDRRAKELIEEYWEELLRHPTVTKSAPTLTICGAGFLSQCLAIQAVRRWDSDPPRPASKVKVRVVGPGAKSMVERLFERYQGIEKHGDLSSKEISPESAKFVKTVLHFNADIVFISLDSDELTLRTALEIVHQIRDPHIKIVPCMHSDEGLTQIVRGIPPESILLANLYPEGVFKRDFEPEFLTGTHDTMGMAVHEAYIEFGKLKGDSIDTNPSMVSWMELSEEMREFNRRHVEDIPKRLKYLGMIITPASGWEVKETQFEDAQVEDLAKCEHKCWKEDLETKGWKKGPKSKIKHNPNLVAWDELVDLSQERGKYLAKQLPTILKKANFEIIPIVKDTETFARILHNNYLMRHGKDSDDKSLESDAALRPWMDLTDEFRLSNIHQAENIFRKLADNGWTVQRKKRGGVQHFSGKEISLMAEQEHIRWMKERLDQGWIYAPGPKNTTTRENPLLRNWDKLTPNEQHETREEVASWPELLKCAGLFLVRKEPANDSSGKSK